MEYNVKLVNPQTNEPVKLDLSIEAGLPVHYEIFWDDGTTNEVYDENGKRNQTCSRNSINALDSN